jgi:predicted nucleic acid-binding protein
MKLAEVASGAVYVDTNVLYMYLRGDPSYLPEIRVFLSRVIRGEIEAFIGLPVLDELYYRLLLGRIKETTSQKPLDFLRKNLVAAIETHCKPIEAALRKLTALSHVYLVGVENADFDRMLNNIKNFSLLPRDAVHLSIMQRLELTAIASDDRDFDRIASIERHWVVQPPGKDKLQSK